MGIIQSINFRSINQMASLTTVEKGDVLKKLNKLLLIFYAGHANGQFHLAARGTRMRKSSLLLVKSEL